MREPRPGVAWSRARVAMRRRYASYMTSPTWFARRRRWVAEHQMTTGGDPACVVCGEVWSEHHGDLHHRSYARLGHEDFSDLLPLCRSCHEHLHLLLDANPAWRYRPRAEATDHLVAYLAHQHHHRFEHQPQDRQGERGAQ